MGAVAGVLNGLLQMIEGGATHIGVATDHVIESFRNQLWPGYKSSAGVPRDLLDQFGLLEVALEAMGVLVWPMVELNSTSWSGGALDGKKEVFLTPGLVVGAFPIAERLHLGLGAGVQIAVTQFHRYNHRWIASIRLPF